MRIERSSYLVGSWTCNLPPCSKVLQQSIYISCLPACRLVHSFETHLTCSWQLWMPPRHIMFAVSNQTMIKYHLSITLCELCSSYELAVSWKLYASVLQASHPGKWYIYMLDEVAAFSKVHCVSFHCFCCFDWAFTDKNWLLGKNSGLCPVSCDISDKQ